MKTLLAPAALAAALTQERERPLHDDERGHEDSQDRVETDLGHRGSARELG